MQELTLPPILADKCFPLNTQYVLQLLFQLPLHILDVLHELLNAVGPDGLKMPSRIDILVKLPCHFLLCHLRDFDDDLVVGLVDELDVSEFLLLRLGEVLLALRFDLVQLCFDHVFAEVHGEAAIVDCGFVPNLGHRRQLGALDDVGQSTLRDEVHDTLVVAARTAIILNIVIYHHRCHVFLEDDVQVQIAASWIARCALLIDGGILLPIEIEVVLKLTLLTSRTFVRIGRRIVCAQ